MPTQFKNYDLANAVALLADGKIVVVGQAGLVGDFAGGRRLAWLQRALCALRSHRPTVEHASTLTHLTGLAAF